MGMGIAGAHHLSAVLKDLHVTNARRSAELAELLPPASNYLFDLFRGHRGQRQVMTRRKAHDTANAGLAFCHEQACCIHVEPARGGGWLQRSEIVFEDKGVYVCGILLASGALVSRT